MEFSQSLIFLLFLLLFAQFPGAYCCHDDERAALLTFRSFLIDSSSRLSSWEGKNCCKWHGIQCSNTSHVISVDLRNPTPVSFMRNLYSELVPTSSKPTALNGTISPSLFKLHHLKHLDLSYNNFDTKIPHHFNNLKNLVYLNLSNSMLSGSITTQFANLSSLKYLDISCSFMVLDYSSLSYDIATFKESNRYSTSYVSTSYVSSADMNWLRGLANLQVLSLKGIDLSVASSTKNWAEPISFLVNLRELYLSNCDISSSIPIHEFHNLSRLSVLLMDSNFLNSPIPVQLANFTSLSYLDLKNCQLQGSITYLPQLQYFDVSVNPDLIVDLTHMFDNHWPKLQVLSITLTKVFGLIPSSISNSTLLFYLSASGCSIQGSLPASISNLSQLQYINLSFNNISGHLPSSISNLKTLEFLNLIENGLQGPIPESICEILSLKYLLLRNNNLSGTIPSCIAKLRNLQSFGVTGNIIEGTISLMSLFQKSNPTLIGLGHNQLNVKINQHQLSSKFQELQILGLQSCNLKGYIPAFICNLTQLILLDLSADKLTGAIPLCIFKLTNLSYLNLASNNLQGTLPHSIYLTQLFPFSVLRLANNELRGPLPLPPENTGVFDLSENQFTGGISTETGERLSNAVYISLSGNELSGPIPSSICSNEHVMQLLDLSNNRLSGKIPSTLINNCSSLTTLNLGTNTLSGNVPKGFGRAKKLKYLQLRGNTLSGTFPSFIEQLQDLEVLDLGSNNFEGTIPTFIGSIHNLKILQIRSNMFNGSIPKEITGLHKLQILDLSLNKISGRIPEEINNLEMLKSRPKTTLLFGDFISLEFSGVQLEMVTKGMIREYSYLSNFHSGIDLSNNVLEGSIPEAIGFLKGLAMLNISHNRLSGTIPTSVGSMIGLESLDFSYNFLSGGIPPSLTSIDALQILDLAYNNLSGRIPTGPHFDTIWSGDGDSPYIGNPFLCGIPPRKSCSDDLSTSTNPNLLKDEDDQGEEEWLLYFIVFMGYAVGFWGLFIVMFIRKEKWWFRYWRCIDIVALSIIGCISKN